MEMPHTRSTALHKTCVPITIISLHHRSHFYATASQFRPLIVYSTHAHSVTITVFVTSLTSLTDGHHHCENVHVTIDLFSHPPSLPPPSPPILLPIPLSLALRLLSRVQRRETSDIIAQYQAAYPRLKSAYKSMPYQASKNIKTAPCRGLH